MKANEAPEKLYFGERDKGILDIYSTKESNNDIEYIRKDAFIEKALKWYCLDCECNDNCKDTKCFFHNEYKRFLEGKENACPPKFEYTILNPDGSTSDNWRHRHFIRKMQDAFIEKAAEYLIDYEFNDSPTIADRRKRVDEFRKYMKGE